MRTSCTLRRQPDAKVCRQTLPTCKDDECIETKQARASKNERNVIDWSGGPVSYGPRGRPPGHPWRPPALPGRAARACRVPSTKPPTSTHASGELWEERTRRPSEQRLWPSLTVLCCCCCCCWPCNWHCIDLPVCLSVYLSVRLPACLPSDHPRPVTS